jgi:signal transduction histidine kinase
MGVLLVEDEQAAQDTIARVFQKIFANTFTANSVEEASSIFLEHKKSIDIVVTDIFLGQRSGFELIEEIKKRNKNVKFIAISGYESTQNFTKAIDLDVESFIVKPIVTDSLLFSVQKAAKKIDTEKRLKESKLELQKTKERALQLLYSQDDFIKDAIHELHTPLSIIVTNADLIAMSHGNLKELAPIQAACKVLQTSYEDMAYMMKKDSQIFHNSEINLADFIRERVFYFKSIADANSVSLVCDIEYDDIIVEMADVKLQRLIDNNLSNAIKYSKRSREIKISLYLEHGHPAVEFHNFGPVINDKKGIFKRYYREENGKGGYGIGLKLVCDICKEYRVNINVSSSESRGNSFRYTFTKFTNATIVD